MSRPRCRSLAAVFLVPLVACYGSAPPKPAAIPLPPMTDGASIDVESKDVTTVEQVQKEARSCPQYHPEACTTTTYSEAEPVTRTHTTATYGGQLINYAQFKVMTDPHYDEKLVQLEHLSHVCRRANVPRYIGLAAVIGGIVLFQVGAGSKDQNTGLMLVGGGVFGGGIASYATGYFSFGGRECTQARALYDDVNHEDEQGWTQVTGAEYAHEMKTLADQFNAAHAAHAATSLEMR
jgi:hypothetical protein